MSKLPYICPDHPDAQIRHEWNRTRYVWDGMPRGSGIDHGHQYFCNECGRELTAEPEESAATASGEISLKEYNTEMRDLQRSYREAELDRRIKE